jgi:hypothetical protein
MSFLPDSVIRFPLEFRSSPNVFRKATCTQLMYMLHQQGTPRAPDFKLRAKLKRLEWVDQLAEHHIIAFRSYTGRAVLQKLLYST